MRVLAIDPGAASRAGAVPDASGTLATPWQVIETAGSLEADVEKLAAIVTELKAEDDGLKTIVVGLPLRLDGTPTDQTGRARELAARLEGVTGLQIVLQDERLTSREAEQRLAPTGASGKRNWMPRPRQSSCRIISIAEDAEGQRTPRKHTADAPAF